MLVGSWALSTLVLLLYISSSLKHEKLFLLFMFLLHKKYLLMINL